MPAGIPVEEVRASVMHLLRGRTEPICDAGIEQALGYGDDTVNSVNNAFKRAGLIRRGRGICPHCGKSKLVNLIA